MKKLIISSFVLWGVLIHPETGAAQIGPIGGGVVFCSNCVDQTTGIASLARQATQLVQETQTALQALQMAQMMVREGVQLAEHPSTNIMADLGMLSSILIQSQGLAGTMARMDAQFQNTYAPYSPNPFVSYAAQYNNWATTALKSLNGSLNSAGYQGQMLQNEGLWMARIQTMNQTAMGRDQALQLGNTIAVQEVSQMQGLRQLMMADMQSKAAFLAGQVNQQQAAQSSAQNGFGYATPVTTGKAW